MKASNSHRRFCWPYASRDNDYSFILDTRECQFFRWQIGVKNLPEYGIMPKVLVCFTFKIFVAVFTVNGFTYLGFDLL